MKRSAATVAAAGGLLLFAGCVRYEPRPLEPAAHVAEYRARDLDDPVLRDWVARHAGAVEGGRWTDRQLALVALAHRADVERARREWLAARAAVAAVGLRPAPGVEAGVERAVGGSEESSPWVVSVAGLFTVELGGKRAARLQAARAREAAGRAELAISVARALGRVRQAVLALRHGDEEREQAVAAHTALRRVEALERVRFAEAALGSGEVARTATEAAAARAEAAAAEREVALARADLAGALAVPAARLRELAAEPSAQRGCEWKDGIGGDSVAALALLRRGEIAAALADYAAAEADVRTQVATRYPDLKLGAGFIWDQGVRRWLLSAALPELLGLRSRGPIAAAEAGRHAAAARVAQVQDELLAEVERAAEHCGAAVLERQVADSQRVAAEAVAALARRSYERGETARLDLARAELLVARATALERAAARRLERAGLALELAAAEWQDAASVRWPDPRRSPFGNGGELE